MNHRIFFLLMAMAAVTTLTAQNAFNGIDDSRLADGKTFKSWEQTAQYSRVFYVDQQHPAADDTNDGTEERPLKTVNAAAQRLKAGEKVIIKQGVYREQVVPQQGGTSPRDMIAYEAAPGHSVILCGSVVLSPTDFEKSQGWYFPPTNGLRPTVWQISRTPEWFQGYNPFAMTNILHDLTWLDYKRAKMTSHFKRRGMLFIDGQPVPQVMTPKELGEGPDLAFWIEHNGQRLHLRLPEGRQPSNYMLEATNCEQVFAPSAYGLGYIKIKGITFRHAGNGFPVPQRGMVSTNRGHHWIVEDCTIEWANSIGMDMGNTQWNAEFQPIQGNHIVRRNTIRHCGISGFQCYLAKHMLVEDNMLEDIGWQDAEHAFESAGIKFHHAENCLIRRNVFRQIKYAPGLWLDNMSNKNCRVACNLFHDITTARGAIYIEVSRNNCSVDHNIIYKTRCQWWLSGEYGAGGSGFYTDGSDSIRFTNNLVIDAENTGYGAYLNAERIIGMRGGTTCDHQVRRNIFVDCNKHCIEFPNTRQHSDENIFVNPKPGYIKLGNPTPPLKLDVEAANKLYGWDGHSQVWNKLQYSFDDNSLTLNITINDDLPLQAGPFALKCGNNHLNVDPRQK